MIEWHVKTPEELERLLETDLEKGLSEETAQLRGTEKKNILFAKKQKNKMYYIYSSGLVFEYLDRVTAHGFHRNPFEIVLVSIKGHTIDTGNPKPVAGVLVYILDLIVGKGILLIGTEMLVEFMDVETVQSSKSTDPYMSMYILGKRGNPLVGNVICDKRCVRIKTAILVSKIRTRDRKNSNQSS